MEIIHCAQNEREQGVNQKDQTITKVYEDVVSLFTRKVQETLLFENKSKHLYEVSQIIQRCGETAKILDCGGGVGVNLLVLSRLNPKYQLFLIDRFEEYTTDNIMGDYKPALPLLSSSNINVVKQDFVEKPRLPYNNESFDIVTFFDVMEHLPTNPIKQLREIYRVLKRNGYICVSGPNAISLIKRQALLRGKVPYIPFDLWCKDKYFSHYREYSPQECSRLLEMTGFEDIHIELRSSPEAFIHGIKRDQRNYFISLLARLNIRANMLIEAIVPNFRYLVYCFGRRPDK